MIALCINFLLTMLFLFPVDPATARATVGYCCAACGYCLSGLPTDAVCPECGIWTDRSPSRPIARHRFQPDRTWPAVQCLFVALAFVVCYVPLGIILVRCSYVVQGYDWKVAYWAANTRELARGGFEGMVWPLAVNVAIMPMLARLPHRRAATVLPWTALTVGAVCTIGLWTIPYTSWALSLRR